MWINQHKMKLISASDALKVNFGGDGQAAEEDICIFMYIYTPIEIFMHL